MEKQTYVEMEVALNLKYKSDPNVDKGGGDKKIRKSENIADIISGSSLMVLGGCVSWTNLGKEGANQQIIEEWPQ